MIIKEPYTRLVAEEVVPETVFSVAMGEEVGELDRLVGDWVVTNVLGVELATCVGTKELVVTG